MADPQSDRVSDGSYMRTVVHLKTYTFNWTIENFSKLPLNTKVTSHKFQTKVNSEFRATLERNSSECNLVFEKSSGSSIRMRHRLYVMNSSKEVIFSAETSHWYGCATELTCCVSSKFVSDKIQEVCNAAKDDVVIFKCVMEWSEVETETDQYRFRPNPVSESQNLSALSNDLKAMYAVSLYADVSLKVDDNIVRVHKSVMCARSSVFQKMFMTPMGESEKNLIVITDLELPVLKDLVAFMYTGVLANDDLVSVYALYYAADKYDVPSLRKTCSDVLLSRLDVENACRVLTLANRHYDAEFKEAVMEYIKFYHVDVLDTDAWDELVRDDTLLASEVMALRGKKRKAEVDTDIVVESVNEKGKIKTSPNLFSFGVPSRY